MMAVRLSEGDEMYTVVRHYKDNAMLFDELVHRGDDVESIIRSVPGFVEYYLVRTPDGGFSIGFFEDETGTVESSRRAADYLRESLAELAGSPPEMIEGKAIMHFRRT
jgi:hypothetical protein